MGARGTIWYDETRGERFIPSLNVPDDKVIDTNGAGDIFHGAYVYSYLSNPKAAWDAHVRFARAASAHAIRFLGNEARLPTEADVKAAERRYPQTGGGI